FDLTLDVEEDDAGCALTMTYRSDLLDRRIARQMLAGYVRLLEGAVADPALPIGRLPLGPGSASVLSGGPPPGAAPPPPGAAGRGGVHRRFEAWAAAAPDALAVESPSERLARGELNARANRLARRLHHDGVGPGVVVGLFVERSASALVGLLA